MSCYTDIFLENFVLLDEKPAASLQQRESVLHCVSLKLESQNFEGVEILGHQHLKEPSIFFIEKAHDYLFTV